MKTDSRSSIVQLARVLYDFIGPAAAAVFGTTVWLISIAQPNIPNESVALWLRTLLTLSWFAFLFLTASTLARRFRAMSARQTLLSLVVIALLLAYAFLCIHQKYPALAWEYGTLFTALGILAVIVVPWLGHSDDAGFWTYNWRLLTRTIWTTAIGIVLMLGLNGALLAVGYLFQQTIDWRIYTAVSAIVCGLIMPLHFLVGAPTTEVPGAYPKFIRVFALYILLPLLAIYLIILYAYAVQILLTQQWPKGGLANIVLWYAFIGTSVLAFATPALTGSGRGRLLARLYWISLLPLLVLLFFAIGKRIAEYGITESRYEVTFAGVWFFLCAVYSVWRSPAALRIYAIALFGLLLVALVPGIGPVAVSIRSQLARIPSVQHALSQDPTDSKGQIAAENLFTYLSQRVDYRAFRPYVSIDLGSLVKNIEDEEQQHMDPEALRLAVFPQLKRVTVAIVRLTFIVDNTPKEGNSANPLSISDFRRLTRFSAAAGSNGSQYHVTLDGQSVVFHRNEGDLTYSLQALMTSLTQDQKTTDRVITNVGWDVLRVADPSGQKVLQLTELSLEKRDGGCSASHIEGFLLER